MKAHVTTEQTKKSIKVQEIFSVLALILGFLALLSGIIGENNFLFVLGVLGFFLGWIWKLVFIRLQKWWHHG